MIRLNSMGAAVAVCVLLLLCCSRTTVGAQQSNQGIMIPANHAYLKVGDDLTLTCYLYSTNETSNSDHLRITSMGVPRPVTRINESTIVYHAKNVSEGRTPYTCKNRDQGVGFTTIYVGREAEPVQNFRCINFNFENLNCTFDFKENFVTPTYTLDYVILPMDHYERQMTLKVNQNKPPPFWFQFEYYTASSFDYIINMTVKNNFSQLTQNFRINAFKSLRMAPPINVTTLEDPRGGQATLYWQIHTVMKWYSNVRQGNNTVVTQIILKSKHERRVVEAYESNATLNQSFELRGLTAFTEYTVTLRMRGNKTYNREELWSDWVSHKFWTRSKIPDHPPETNVGAFWVNELDEIVIYWKTLKEFEYNAANATYLVTKDGGTSKSVNPNETQVKWHVKSLKEHEHTFEIYSRNADGRSLETSVVRVPRNADRPAYPSGLTKNFRDNRYTFTWRPPTSGAELITSYTVFWCKAKSERPNQCEGSLEFKQLGSDQYEYVHNTSDGINFAVSANTATVSSGMMWAKCTASEDIGKLNSIWMNKISAHSMDIHWNLECSDEFILKNYSLTYCPIVSPKNITCREGTERNVTVLRNATQYTITGLWPYTTYKTFIVMYSQDRMGAASDPQINTTYEAAPSKPLNLTFSDVRNTSVQLSWQAPEHLNGKLKYYRIGFNNQDVDFTGEFKAGQQQNYTLKGLKSYTDYDIVVKACSNCCGCSESSEQVRIKTKVGTPGIVTTSISTNSPENKVTVDWSSPELKAGNVDFFEVRVQNSLNQSSEIKTRASGCMLSTSEPAETSSLEADVTWTVQVRAVNVHFSSHDQIAKEGQVSFADPPTPRESCLVEDRELIKRLNLDAHYTPYPGNWSVMYTHKTGTASIKWRLVAATAVFGALLVASAVYVYKRFFRLKKGGVLLPPGLTDIAAKPHTEGKGEGGLPGLLGHGNGTVMGTDSMGGNRLRSNLDKLYDGKTSSSSDSSTAPIIYSNENDHHMNHHNHHMHHNNNSSSRTVPTSGVISAMGGDSHSLHEQEQSLLEDRMDGQSSSASSSSINIMLEHEEGAMLSDLSRHLNGREAEEEERPMHQHEPMSVAGLNSTSMQHDVLAAIAKEKQQQQQLHFQQMHHQMQPMPIPTPSSHTVIKPASNGYVTITQRSDGYRPLDEFIKPMQQQMQSPAEDKGITGYVTHKQLADFGQRMQ